MKKYKRGVVCFLVVLVFSWGIHSNVFAWEKWKKDDPITDEWKMIDILIARPIGIAAGIIGTAIFVISLPFTLSTNGVEEAANTFIYKPFQFSFTRPCPDDDM